MTKPQKPKPYVQHLVTLRNGNGAQPHRNRKIYSRKGRNALDYRRAI